MPHRTETGQSFTWGTTIKVQAKAPLSFRPGESGEICGVRPTSNDEAGNLYLVEFADGVSIEIPDHYLEVISR